MKQRETETERLSRRVGEWTGRDQRKKKCECDTKNGAKSVGMDRKCG